MKIKAIGLLSGGLDSILCVKVLQEQGIEVTGLSFVTPFFGSRPAQKAAGQLNIELIIKDITPKHFEIVKNPPHGYGKTMNPCIDCHALMLNIAGEMMEAEGYDFIFTGEVLDERPMSQNRRSLEVVAKTSGYQDYILRPLSAKLLDITKPEEEGKVDREKLLDIRGRSRKPQIELAKKYGIKEYPNPAGGCLLTDKGFSARLKELLDKDPDPEKRQLELLSIGRHFRLSDTAKVIVGRNFSENQRLQDISNNLDYVLTAENIPGPWCLVVGADLEAVLEPAARICAAYSDIEQGETCFVEGKNQGKEFRMQVTVDKTDRTNLRIN